jgi:hypothetical protein
VYSLTRAILNQTKSREILIPAAACVNRTHKPLARCGVAKHCHLISRRKTRTRARGERSKNTHITFYNWSKITERRHACQSAPARGARRTLSPQRRFPRAARNNCGAQQNRIVSERAAPSTPAISAAELDALCKLRSQWSRKKWRRPLPASTTDSVSE